MTRTTSVSFTLDIDTMTEAMPQRLEGVATTSKERNQMTEQTNRYNAALDLARAVIMGDGKRAEAVAALVEQHGLTEEEAHQFVTAAQNGYLRQIQIRNPEAWDELGLGPVPEDE